MSTINCIITDIEGTTTSIDFVYDVLFPYFRENIELLKEMTDNDAVMQCLKETQEIVKKENGIDLDINGAIEQLRKWSVEDRKVGPLKSIQGILWEKGYKDGEIKGHVYDDVLPKLKEWKINGIQLGIYSSGSVKAQKLLFGYSVFGDLNPYFSFNFDLKVGHKRETPSYTTIAKELNTNPATILFLSDVVEELDAAIAAGFNTIQLVREGTVAGDRHPVVKDFSEIQL